MPSPCAHRFGIDPTLVDGKPTQLQGDQIVFVDLGDND
jgi:hypothetical protein